MLVESNVEPTEGVMERVIRCVEKCFLRGNLYNDNSKSMCLPTVVGVTWNEVDAHLAYPQNPSRPAGSSIVAAHATVCCALRDPSVPSRR